MPTPVFSPAEITGLRSLVSDLAFTDTFEILRDTLAPDGMGGTTHTQTVAGTGVCRFQQLKVRITFAEQIVAGELISAMPYQVDLPYGTDVRASDRLRINGDRVVEVMGVAVGESWGLMTTAIAKETR